MQSSDVRELALTQWLNQEVLGSATGPAGGNMGVDFLIRVLEIIHWKLDQKRDPEAFLDVVKDAVRYVRQGRTGNVVSPEEAPSSLARVLEQFLDKFVPEQGATERHERLVERILENVESAVEWCEKRDDDFFSFLDKFFSEYNLPGWEPAKERGDKLIIPEDTYGDAEEGAPTQPGDQSGDQDSDLIIPGQ